MSDPMIEATIRILAKKPWLHSDAGLSLWVIDRAVIDGEEIELDMLAYADGWGHFRLIDWSEPSPRVLNATDIVAARELLLVHAGDPLLAYHESIQPAIDAALESRDGGESHG